MEENMGVVTTADEKLNSASEHIKAAAQDLSVIVLDECWGCEDYRADYTTEIHSALNTLIMLKAKLNR
jgi:replicative superfamily II helicase